jgi:signal transduction histidine kinase
VSSLVFFVLYLGLYQEQLARQREETATQINRLLRTSLENAMLKRDLEGLREIVNRLGQQPGISAVTITNATGQIRFSSQPGRFGSDFLYPIPSQPTTAFVAEPGGGEVLRSANPVANKEECQPCHGPAAAHPLNGVLYVDYDAQPIRQQARETTLLLLGAGSLIVLLNLTGGWWFINRYVLNPVKQLTEVSERLRQGDLDARIALTSGDELAHLGETFNAMAERLQGKIRSLEDKEAFLQGLIDAIPDGVRVIDSNFQVLMANRGYRLQLGLDPSGVPLGTCFGSSHALADPCPGELITCPVRELIHASGAEPLRIVQRHIKVDGTPLDVEIYAAPLRVRSEGKPQTLVVESIRDLERQIRFSHEQKLAELGRLAAGVAHEIYNPLSSVRLALSACQRHCTQEHIEREQMQRNLDLVSHEVDQCIEVTQRLLKLSAPPATHPELVVVDTLIEETLSLLGWEAEKQGIAVELRFEQRPLRALASDGDIRRLVLNLAQNAFHAMPEGGRLGIVARRTAGYLEVRFRDSGLGIDPGELRRIFEPFFSRRADGVRGMGLGLPIAKNIVENYAGSLSVESTQGAGSCFTFRLPDADAKRET